MEKIAKLSKKPLAKNRAKQKAIEDLKWVEVAPYGLVGGMLPNISLMIFRNKVGSKRFAISLSHLQGEITVQQGKNKEDSFRFMTELLENLKMKISKCYFLKYEKGYIKTQVELHGHLKLTSITVNARDIIPFAIYSGCRFYCTDEFIEEMQSQKVELTIENGPARKPDYLN